MIRAEAANDVDRRPHATWKRQVVVAVGEHDSGAHLELATEVPRKQFALSFDPDEGRLSSCLSARLALLFADGVGGVRGIRHRRDRGQDLAQLKSHLVRAVAREFNAQRHRDEVAGPEVPAFGEVGVEHRLHAPRAVERLERAAKLRRLREVELHDRAVDLRRDGHRNDRLE